MQTSTSKEIIATGLFISLFVFAYVLPKIAEDEGDPSGKDNTQHIAPTPTPATAIKHTQPPRETRLPQLPTHTPIPTPIPKEQSQSILSAPAGDIENLVLVGFYGNTKQWAFRHSPTNKIVRLPENMPSTLAMTGQGEEAISIIVERIDSQRLQILYDAKGKVFDLTQDLSFHADETPRPLRPILGLGVTTIFGEASAAGRPSPSRRTPAPERQAVSTVYITNTGNKYHRTGCRYLDESQVPVSIESAKSQGYTACQVCGGRGGGKR